MKLRVALAAFFNRWLSFPDEASSGQDQGDAAAQGAGGPHNEYFRLYRKLTGLK